LASKLSTPVAVPEPPNIPTQHVSATLYVASKLAGNNINRSFAAVIFAEQLSIIVITGNVAGDGVASSKADLLEAEEITGRGSET